MENAHPAEHQGVGIPTDPQDDAYLWAFVRRQGGQWHATSIDYSIVGSGSSPEEALESLRSMVAAYLESCAQDGLAPEDALRPISLRWSLSFFADSLRRSARLPFRRRRDSPGGQVFIPRVGC